MQTHALQALQALMTPSINYRPVLVEEPVLRSIAAAKCIAITSDPLWLGISTMRSYIHTLSGFLDAQRALSTESRVPTPVHLTHPHYSSAGVDVMLICFQSLYIKHWREGLPLVRVNHDGDLATVICCKFHACTSMAFRRFFALSH